MTVLSLTDAGVLGINSAVFHRDGDRGVIKTWSRSMGCPFVYVVEFWSIERCCSYKRRCIQSELEPVVVSIVRDTAPCEMDVGA